MKTDKNHITPLYVYLGVGAVLLILTAITVGVSYINFGPWNLVIALAIAIVKATLVAFFFMHLYYDNKIYMMVFTISLLFLVVFISLTMFDTLRRGEINKTEAEPIKKEAIIYK